MASHVPNRLAESGWEGNNDKLTPFFSSEKERLSLLLREKMGGAACLSRPVQLWIQLSLHSLICLPRCWWHVCFTPVLQLLPPNTTHTFAFPKTVWPLSWRHYLFRSRDKCCVPDSATSVSYVVLWDDSCGQGLSRPPVFVLALPQKQWLVLKNTWNHFKLATLRSDKDIHFFAFPTSLRLQRVSESTVFCSPDECFHIFTVAANYFYLMFLHSESVLQNPYVWIIKLGTDYR